MMNATEMNKIATEVKEAKEKGRIARTMDFIEEEIMPQIMMSAEQGNYYTLVEVNLAKYHLATIGEILTDNGYTVSRTKWANQIKIYW